MEFQNVWVAFGLTIFASLSTGIGIAMVMIARCALCVSTLLWFYV